MTNAFGARAIAIVVGVVLALLIGLAATQIYVNVSASDQVSSNPSSVGYADQ